MFILTSLLLQSLVSSRVGWSIFQLSILLRDFLSIAVFMRLWAVGSFWRRLFLAMSSSVVSCTQPPSPLLGPVMMFCCSAVMSGSHSSRRLTQSLRLGGTPDAWFLWSTSSSSQLIAILFSFLLKWGPWLWWPRTQPLSCWCIFSSHWQELNSWLLLPTFGWEPAIACPHSVFHLCSTEPFILLLSPCMCF